MARKLNSNPIVCKSPQLSGEWTWEDVSEQISDLRYMASAYLKMVEIEGGDAYLFHCQVDYISSLQKFAGPSMTASSSEENLSHLPRASSCLSTEFSCPSVVISGFVNNCRILEVVVRGLDSTVFLLFYEAQCSEQNMSLIFL